jgi:signal transduction histidine kinase
LNDLEIAANSERGPLQGDMRTRNTNATGIGNRTDVSEDSNKSAQEAYKGAIETINHYKQNIEELRTVYNKQKEFISVAVHELRSPITPILGTLELIELEFEETGKDEIPLRKDLYERLLRNANRLERLASEILDVTKISDDSMNLYKVDFNLGTTMSEAIEDHRKQLKQNNINTKLIYENETLREKNKSQSGGMPTVNDPIIYGDKDRITQVIYNMLGNAIKFTEHGTITVFISRLRMDSNRNGIMVSVRDTGTGIHPDVLPKLFCVFTTKSENGTGLGLYISKNIIEAHGGKMWGENNTNRRGATFSFIIPAKS